MTTARYYTPSGRSIQAKGIEPDIEVKPAKIEEFNDEGMIFSEADLENALQNDNIDNGTPGKTEKTKADKDTIKDYQLMRAIDTVKALSLYSERQK